MDRAFQRIRSLMLRGTFYSVPPKDSSYQKLLEKKYLLFSLTIKDNPILMIFVWRRKERQVT